MDVARTVNAPCEAVWSLLTDTEQWPRWGPSVTAVRCAERFIRDGSRGAVRTPAGIWLPFEITGFSPMRHWRWRVAGLPATGHRVEPRQDGTCRLVFEVPLLAAPYGAICLLAAARIARLLEV